MKRSESLRGGGTELGARGLEAEHSFILGGRPAGANDRYGTLGEVSTVPNGGPAGSRGGRGNLGDNGSERNGKAPHELGADLALHCECPDDEDYLFVELSKRLERVWRYEQYIARATAWPGARDFWERIKQQEENKVARLMNLVAPRVEQGLIRLGLTAQA